MGFKNAVWQKIGVYVAICCLFISLARGQSVFDPPSSLPKEAGFSQMLKAKNEVLTREWDKRELSSFSMEQLIDLYNHMRQAQPDKVPNINEQLNAAILHQPMMPVNFDQLDGVMAHNAHLITDTVFANIAQVNEVFNLVDQRLLKGSDIENLDPRLLNWGIMQYADENHEKAQVSFQGEKKPDETREEFNRRMLLSAFGPIAGENLWLISRYLDYYEKNGLKFGR